MTRLRIFGRSAYMPELALAIHKWTAGREWVHAKGGHHFSDHCICYHDAEAIAREYDGPVRP